MALKDIIQTATGSLSGVLTGLTPYLLAGSLIAGTAGGFFLGSVYYGNKYKGELDVAHQQIAQVQQRYDGFKAGALAQAGVQNDKVNALESKVATLTLDLEDAHQQILTAESHRSNNLKSRLKNAQDGQLLSDTGIDYFKRLRSGSD